VLIGHGIKPSLSFQLLQQSKLESIELRFLFLISVGLKIIIYFISEGFLQSQKVLLNYYMPQTSPQMLDEYELQEPVEPQT
jgi:hypothetical protein